MGQEEMSSKDTFKVHDDKQNTSIITGPTYWAMFRGKSQPSILSKWKKRTHENVLLPRWKLRASGLKHILGECHCPLSCDGNRIHRQLNYCNNATCQIWSVQLPLSSLHKRTSFFFVFSSPLSLSDHIFICKFSSQRCYLSAEKHRFVSSSSCCNV